MTRFSLHADVNKSGIMNLDAVGAYVVIANKALQRQGKASKFAVVNASEEWIDSVHKTRSAALAAAEALYG